MIHNVLVKERTKDNEFAAAMMLGLNVSEGAKALSRIMKLQCVDFVAFMQKFIDVWSPMIKRPCCKLEHGQGQLLKGNIRHAGAYIQISTLTTILCVTLVCVGRSG